MGGMPPVPFLPQDVSRCSGPLLLMQPSDGSSGGIMRLLKVLSVVVLAVTVLAAQQKNPLTNADVIKMVKAGMAETTIAAAIAAHDPQFDLSSAGLQALNQAGVSSKVIRAMLAAEAKKKDAAA